jgi:hypothetical protein
MIMIRYAADVVVGFQHESDAHRFWGAMHDRLRKFSLSLHPDKTRLIEFGRFAAQNCKKRGLAKPETFTFLGFVLVCGKSRRGDFRVRRKSRGDRMKTKLREIKEALRQRTNRPIPETGKWLAQVVAGYFAYHAVPTNGLALSAFRYHVKHLWHRQLSAQPESLEGEKNQGALFPAISIDDRKRVIADGLVGEARMLAGRERFFHWEIGFPMSGSISPAPNLKAALTRFGNPPYVRQELLGDGVKRALKGGYKAFDGVADSMFTSTSKGCVFCGPAAAWATSSPTNG